MVFFSRVEGAQTPQTGIKRITYSMVKMMPKKTKIQKKYIENTKTSKRKCKKKISMQNPQTGITAWCKKTKIQKPEIGMYKTT